MVRWATLGVVAGLLAAAPLAAQDTVSFEQVVGDLGSDRRDVRLAAVRALKASPYPEGAVPLSRVVVDPDDTVQLEAIGAILNIYLAEPIVPSKRVGLVVEVRNRVAAEAAFAAGSAAIEPTPIPDEVLTALRTALQDDQPRVALEAAYAFGALAPEVAGARRGALLRASASELAGRLGSPRPDARLAAVQVIDRLYAARRGDGPVPESIGDALVVALNDSSSAVRLAAMRGLGALRYERGVQALTDLVAHHERGAIAAAALEALARIAHASSVPLFEANLASRNAVMRRCAVEGLARIARPDDAGRIRTVMESERSESVLLAGHFAAVLLSAGPVDGLIEGLTRRALHDQALGYLIEIAPGRGRTLGVHLQDPDLGVRTDLLEALSLSGESDALPAIDRVARDADASVARAARRAAARIRAAATPAQ